MSDFVLSCSVTRSKRVGLFNDTGGSEFAVQKPRKNLINQRRSRRSLGTNNNNDAASCGDTGQSYHKELELCKSGDIGTGDGGGANRFTAVNRSSSCRLNVSSCAMKKLEVDKLRDEVCRKVKPRSRSMRFIGNSESWQARLDGLVDAEGDDDDDGGDVNCGGSDVEEKPFRHIWSYYKSIWSSSSDSDSDYADAVSGQFSNNGKGKEESRNTEVNMSKSIHCVSKTSQQGESGIEESTRAIHLEQLPIVLPEVNSQEVEDSVKDIIHSVEEMTRSALNSIEEYDVGRISTFSVAQKDESCFNDINNERITSTPFLSFDDDSTLTAESPVSMSCQNKGFDMGVVDFDNADKSENLENRGKDSNFESVDYINSHRIRKNATCSFPGEVLTEQERMVYGKPRFNSFCEDGLSSDFGSSMEFLDSSNSELGYYIDADCRLGTKKLVSDDSDLGSSKDDLNSDSDSDALCDGFLTGKLCVSCNKNAVAGEEEVDFAQRKFVGEHKDGENTVGKCRLCVDFSMDEGTFSISSDTYSPPLLVGNVAPFCCDPSLSSVLVPNKQLPDVPHGNTIIPSRGGLGHEDGGLKISESKICKDNIGHSSTLSLYSIPQKEQSCQEPTSLTALSDYSKREEFTFQENNDSISDSNLKIETTCQLPSIEYSCDLTNDPNFHSNLIPLSSNSNSPSDITISEPVFLFPKDQSTDDNVSVRSGASSYRLSNGSGSIGGSPRLGFTREADTRSHEKVRLIELIEFPNKPSHFLEIREQQSTAESTESECAIDETLHIEEPVASLSSENAHVPSKPQLHSEESELFINEEGNEIRDYQRECETRDEVTLRNKKDMVNPLFSSVKHLDLPLISLEQRFPSFFASVPSINDHIRERTSTVIPISPSLPGDTTTTTDSATTASTTTNSTVAEAVPVRISRAGRSHSTTTLSKRYSNCLKTVTSALRRLPSPSKVLHRSSSIFTSHKCAYDLQLASMAYFSSCPSTPVTGKRHPTATPSLLTFTSSSTSLSQSLPPSPCTPFPGTPPSTPSSLRLPDFTTTSPPLIPQSISTPSSSLSAPSSFAAMPASTKLHRRNHNHNYLHGLYQDNTDSKTTNSSSLSSLFYSSSSTLSITTPSGIPPLHSSSPKSSQSSLLSPPTPPTLVNKKPSSFWPSRPSTSKSRKLRYRSLSLDSRISSQCYHCSGETVTPSTLDWDQQQQQQDYLPHTVCLSSFEGSTDSLRVHRPFLLPLYDAKKVERNRLSSPVDSAPKEEKKAQQFGLSLAEIKENTGHIIPKPVDETIEYLKNCQGDEVQGLFRRCARVTTMREVQEKYDDGETVDFSQYGDPHLAGAILKKFLRELSEPLMTFDLFEPITRLHYLEHSKQIAEVQRILKDELPDDNYIILKYIYQFLQQVVSKSEINLMTSANMATVFGPNIAWPKGQANLSNVEQAVKFSLILLDSFDDVFLR